MRTMKTKNFLEVVASSLFLIAAALGGFAWYLTSKYRLPFYALSIITFFLGPVDFSATYWSARGISSSRRNAKRPLPPSKLFINLVLLVLPSVMMALSAQYIADPRCVLENTWQKRFTAKDANAIKGVQDALQCCGFNTVTVEPYPFPRDPSKKKNDAGVPAKTCAIALGHETPCAPLWEAEMKTVAGLTVAAVALLLLLKIIFLMIVVGYPNAAERIFGTVHYGGYQNSRVIEAPEDDRQEAEERPAAGRQIMPAEERTSEDGNDERARLLPRDYGSGGHQITMHDDSARAWGGQ